MNVSLVRFVLVVGLALTVSALPNFTICFMAREGKTEPSLAAMFAVDYYRNFYPSNDWRFKFVVNLDPSINALTTRQVLLGWLQNSTGCDALIGPGHSAYAIAVGPVVSVPWVEYSAQSTQLSDKSQFPTLCRTIPTTDVGPRQTALLVNQLFGWKYANVICVNDAYGTAAAESFTNAFYSFGGGTMTNCIGTRALLPEINGILDLLEAAAYSRVVYIASSVNYVAFDNIIAALLARDTAKEFIIIFSESACSGSSLWSNVSGALCSGYTLNVTTLTPFTAAYAQRNAKAGIDALVNQGFPINTINPFTVTGSAGFSVDAVQLVMASQHWFTVGDVASNGTPLFKFMRNVTVLGLTGLIELNSNCDRPIAAGVLYNTIPGLSGNTSLIAIASIDGSGVSHFTSASSYLLGSTFLNGGATRIVDRDAESSPSSQQTIVVALAVALPVSAVVVAMGIVACRRGVGRNVSNAPKSGQITILFTDIQSSTKLWSACPASMSAAIEIHHDVVRKVISRYGGYEVKTVGDSFMIACKTADMGAKIARGIQHDLQRTKFPSAIAEVYTNTDDDFECLDDTPDRLAPLDPVWNGVRVRIGCHIGEPSVVFDEVTSGYDYYGPPVNLVARLESAARGGQICASREFLQSSGEAGTLMGHVLLKGIPEPVPIFDIATGIAGRVYEPFDRDDQATHNSPNTSTFDVDSFSGAGGDAPESIECAVAKLPVVAKNSVQLHVAVGQVKFIASSFVELFKVIKPQSREALQAQFFTAWCVRGKGKEAFEELALRVYSGARRASVATAATFLRHGDDDDEEDRADLAPELPTTMPQS